MKRIAWLGTLLCLPGLLAAQTLQHRYSFTSDASDSVGHADGIITNSAFINNGTVVLPGDGTSGNPGGYVQLPNGLLSSDTSITVETWLTDNTSATWAEAWCFGDSAAGPGQPPTTGTYYFGLIPHAGRAPNGLWVAFNNSISEIDVTTDTPLPTNSEQYVCVTYDAASATANLYLNGALVGTQSVPATYAPSVMGQTYNDWLGRDQFSGDPLFDGSIDEFRIWNAAVSPLYIALSTAAGPNLVITNFAPTSATIGLTTNSMLGAQTQQAVITASFQQIANINVTAGATNWTSSNPNILTINSSGLITAVNGGSATVSATVGGVVITSSSITVQLTKPSIVSGPLASTNYVGESASLTVNAVGGQLSYQWSKGSTPIPGATNATLVLPSLVASDAGQYSVVVSNPLGTASGGPVSLTVLPDVLWHRWSFNVDGDASDLVGGANGTLMGGATVSGGQLQLPGNDTSGDPSGSYLQLPDGIVSSNTDITVECWLTDTAGSTWAEAWCFGDSDQGPGFAGNGTNYMGLIATSGAPAVCRVDVNLNGTQTTAAPGPLPLNTEEYVVYSSDAASHTGWLYINGALVGVNTGVTHTPAQLGDTFNNWVGRDEFSPDPLFTGSIDELRIWNAAITPLQVALQQAAGPNTVITSAVPTSLTVTVTNATMIAGQTQQASVSGVFAQVPSLNVTGAVRSWTSSNPSVLTVSPSGLITAISTGTATVTADVGGVTQASSTITVTVNPPSVTQAPVSLTRYVGQSANFSVSAIGGLLTYQWSQGSSSINGATNNSLSLSNLALSASGTYKVTIANASGSTNVTAVLTVIEPTLDHRWSFNGDANDSIGGANGTLMGNASISNNAVLLLPGGTTSDDPNGSYVQLPDGIISPYNSITIETWADDFLGSTWAELFCFGDSTGGPGTASGGTNYLGFIPHSGPGDMRAAFRLQNEQDVVWPATTMPTNVEEDIVITYDDTITTATLYLNGQQVGVNHNVTIRPSDMGDTFNNWFGRDQFPDPLFTGYIDEFRIYGGPLSPTDIMNNHLAGPNTLVAPGTVSSSTISISHSGSNVILTWSSGVLMQAPAVNGPWTKNTAATSPYTAPASSGNQFFKVELGP